MSAWPVAIPRTLPGLALAAVVALAALAAEPLMRALTGGFTLPAMVMALIIGIAASSLAARPQFDPGLTFAVKKVLRWAIGLLGLRIALGDIMGLGFGVALLVVASMALTVIAAIWLARMLKLDEGFGALAGAANAVCGASATLAAATSVPDYKNKARDVAFTVVMANAVSTVVMLAYPALCVALGLDPRSTGILLGATIHDMAQVVGAGYAVSEPVGNGAVIVKLFRVFLLLPVVLAIGWWFTTRGRSAGHANVPVPVFALVFLGLCVVNSVALSFPSILPVYAPIKSVLGHVANAGLLLAIAALGLGTSLQQILAIGWRHLAVFMGATVVILVIVAAGLALIA